MTTEGGGQVAAAIDIGSNSVHLLVARVAEERSPGRRMLQPLIDRSELLGLGDVVDLHGAVTDAARAELVATVAGYCRDAAEAGAGRITVIGTEPLRRAANADSVAAELRDATGTPIVVIDVDQEAQLTFLGVTEGRQPAAPMIVVDIGGGSTEVGIFRPGASFDVIPLPIGSARLTAAHVKHDPPTHDELDRLHDAVGQIRTQLPPRSDLAGYTGVLAVFVGGTATNVARLGRLTREGLAADRRVLAELDAASITKRFGVRPQRAPQLASGAAIIDVVLEHFGLAEALSSAASLREGGIVASRLFGDEWPARLGELFG